LKLLEFADGEFEVEVACSKGTYIRTLVEDIAAAVQQRAHVTALRRVSAEPFRQPAMVTLDQLDTCADTAERDALLLPPQQPLLRWRRCGRRGPRFLSRARPGGAGRPPAGTGGDRGAGPGRPAAGIASRNPDGMLAPTRWPGSPGFGLVRSAVSRYNARLRKDD